MPDKNKIIQLWLSLQKVKAYLKAKPLTRESLEDSWVSFKNLSSTLCSTTPKTNVINVSLPTRTTPIKDSLLILSNHLQADKNHLKVRQDILEKWMLAIHVEKYTIQTLPNEIKDLTLADPQAQNWLSTLLEKTNARFIITLGEDILKFFTQQPVLLNYIHGLSFTLELNNRYTLTILPTYTPEQVVNEPSLKRRVWQDLRRLAGILKYERTVVNSRSSS